ncbi:MAG TPA: aminopeptidase [Bacteroidetes bacterium]|nr:aminopeptidase [Bacteroidota bacterium]HCN37280.1 aminopeptidase [Bacteroidota bacterium]
MIKKYLLLLVIPLLAFGINSNEPEITESELKEYVKYLSDSSMAGRFPGTDGDSAARYFIANEFKKFGVEPAGTRGYFQDFEMSTKLDVSETNKFILNNGKAILDLKLRQDFVPYGFSGNGSASGNLLFVGYGINAPELSYDDFKDTLGNKLDLRGKILVMFRQGPDYMNPHGNPFDKYEDARNKTLIPRDEGAAGIIFVNGSEYDLGDRLTRIRYDAVMGNQGIPVVQIKRSFLEDVMSAAGYNLTDIQKKINSDNKPYSFEIPNVTAEFSTQLKPTVVGTTNILGLIEGSDPVLKNEVIVIGAHYDHVGYGTYGSLYSGTEQLIHYGADDNASGTAGVIEIAKKMSENKKDMKRSVLFMLFGGEEAGLLGSSYFVKSPHFKNFNIIAMLNMDMIGRLREKLEIYGTGTSSQWENLLTSTNSKYNFDFKFVPDGFGPSDHSNFYAKQIPVLHFFTGTHEDYHRPSDTWEKVNYAGQTKVVNLVYDVAMNLVNANNKIDYTAVVKKEENTNMNSGPMKVTVGTIPDYSFTGEGVKVTGVRAGTPGEKGGLLAGDVIVKFGEHNIKTIYDYTNVLGKFNPGDVVDVIVKRGDNEVKLTLTLEGRK